MPAEGTAVPLVVAILWGGGTFPPADFQRGRLEFRVLRRGAATLVPRRALVLGATHGIAFKLTLLGA